VADATTRRLNSSSDTFLPRSVGNNDLHGKRNAAYACLHSVTFNQSKNIAKTSLADVDDSGRDVEWQVVAEAV